MTDTALSDAQALYHALKNGRALAFERDNYTLLYVPGSAIDAIHPIIGLVVCEIGQGSAFIADPTRLNKYTFVKSGMTTPAGQDAAKVLKCLARLIVDNKGQTERGTVPILQQPDVANEKV